MSYFNPPAPCGAGPPGPMRLHGDAIFQSTRPLRGGTTAGIATLQARAFQSTRPLRGGTCKRSMLLRCFMPFQSTRPLRGGTRSRGQYAHVSVFQSTRPLRGGTPLPICTARLDAFQSTRPLRGGTAILHKKTVQNIAYCTKSAFTLAVLSGFLALMRPFFCHTCTNFGANLPKNRCSLPVRTLIPSGPPPADSRH